MILSLLIFSIFLSAKVATPKADWVNLTLLATYSCFTTSPALYWASLRFRNVVFMLLRSWAVCCWGASCLIATGSCFILDATEVGANLNSFFTSAGAPNWDYKNISKSSIVPVSVLTCLGFYCTSFYLPTDDALFTSSGSYLTAACCYFGGLLVLVLLF